MPGQTSLSSLGAGEKHNKKAFVKDIKNGDRVKDIFAVASKDPVKEYKNGYMFSLRLSDKTGNMDLKFFGPKDKSHVDGVHSSIKEDSVVHIDASASEYNGKVSLTVNPPAEIRAMHPESYDLIHFIPHTKKDIEGMKSRMKELIASIQDVEIKAFMEHVFLKPEFLDKFAASSAAVYHHHAFAGGLLEHSLSLAEIVLTVHKMHPELNKDYLICGAFLQDVGKTVEITGNLAYGYSDEGHLVGHVVIGAQMVEKACTELKLPKEKALKLVHLVLSHHSKLEYGAPVEPKFPEAVVVGLADELDAKTQKSIEFLEKNTNKEFDYYEFRKHMGSK